MTVQEHQREILRQASAALHGGVVTLWEVSPGPSAAPLVSSVPEPPGEATGLDLDLTLKRWDRPVIQGSRWVGTRAKGRWCIAPLRVQPAAPPPAGTERRSRERLVMELTGLCLGTIHRLTDVGKRRLPPAEALLEHARQPSVIAHEVGNPLAVAQASIELARESIRSAGGVDPALRQGLLDDLAGAIDAIEEATSYLRSIQDRPWGPGDQLSRFDAAPVVRSSVAMERPLARKKGVPLTLQSLVGPVFLYGAPGALYQVITNLIRNAVDASEQRQASVAVTLSRTDHSLVVTVRDQGVGIPTEALGQIFEPGFTRKAGGSGMGLAVVREITYNMFGGTVSVDSREGAGSTFVINLPIPPQRRDQAEAGERRR